MWRLEVSELLSLWVFDVQSNPTEPDSACKSLSPWRWPRSTWVESYHGQTNRAAYLREEFGLTPRNRVIGTQRLGWKTRVMDHKDNYIQVHWFPYDVGKYFWHLWQQYRNLTCDIKRNQPVMRSWLFQATHWNAYTMNAFLYNYESALRRIDMTPSKAEGLDPHGIVMPTGEGYKYKRHQ